MLITNLRSPNLHCIRALHVNAPNWQVHFRFDLLFKVTGVKMKKNIQIWVNHGGANRSHYTQRLVYKLCAQPTNDPWWHTKNLVCVTHFTWENPRNHPKIGVNKHFLMPSELLQIRRNRFRGKFMHCCNLQLYFAINNNFIMHVFRVENLVSVKKLVVVHCSISFTLLCYFSWS